MAQSVRLLIILTLTSTVLELTLWYYQFVRHEPLSSLYHLFDEIIRFGRTAGCAALWLVLWPKRIRLSDARKLSLALILAVVADFFLILRHQFIVGIGFFAVMQVALLVRHGQGFGQLCPTSRLWVALGAGITLLVSGNVLLYAPLSHLGLSLPVLIYSTLLVSSCWVAYAAIYRQVLPVPNARLACWAMLLFLACDITVGIGAAFGQRDWGALVRCTTGLFYTPSLLLLVLSGVRDINPARWFERG